MVIKVREGDVEFTSKDGKHRVLIAGDFGNSRVWQRVCMTERDHKNILGKWLNISLIPPELWQEYVEYLKKSSKK